MCFGPCPRSLQYLVSEPPRRNPRASLLRHLHALDAGELGEASSPALFDPCRGLPTPSWLSLSSAYGSRPCSAHVEHSRKGRLTRIGNVIRFPYHKGLEEAWARCSGLLFYRLSANQSAIDINLISAAFISSVIANSGNVAVSEH